MLRDVKAALRRMIRSRRPVVFVDGVRLQAPGALELIDPRTITGIEVLKGAVATAEYGPDAARGAVLISTKRAGGKVR